ncbi:uncharacterized protein [Haliotis asinina]|uniref:uncharacterized protein n=1 Tax=Haliotis asinina TaxID=109174 RepID=UPI0035327D1E
MNVDIKTAYCQCPGGSDGACRHIAATLFDIEAFEKKSITDGPSLWTKRPRPHDEPVPLAHLKVKKISYGQTLADTSSDYGQDTFDPRPISDRSNPSLEQVANFAASLHQINPNACALESLLDPTDTQIQAMKINEECVAMSLLKKLEALELPPCSDISEDIIDRLKYCPDDISYIEHETTGQSENPTWSVMRKGMVTSSNFKRVCTRADAFEKNKNIDCSKLVKCLLHDSLSTDISNVPSAIVWGKKRESKAKEMYTQIERRRHTKLSVKIKGLLIDKENPFLGTSVDGTVECQCKENHQDKLLEIKCPWALRDCDPKSAAQNRGCYLKDGNWHLKDDSDYYYQIQGQLGIYGFQSCDLVIYTRKGIHVINVPFHEQFFESMIRKIKSIYVKQLLPSLLQTSKIDEDFCQL